MIEVLSHTADIRIRVTAATNEDLFREAMKGLFAVLAPVGQPGEMIEREILVESADRTSLLIDFLNEILGLALVQREAYETIEFLRLEECIVEAKVRGRQVEEFSDDVKAVTYHEAEVTMRDDRWETLIVFDI